MKAILVVMLFAYQLHAYYVNSSESYRLDLPEQVTSKVGAGCPTGYTFVWDMAGGCSGTQPYTTYCVQNCYTVTDVEQNNGAGPGFCTGAYTSSRFTKKFTIVTATCPGCLTQVNATTKKDSLTRVCKFGGGSPEYFLQNVANCYTVGGQCVPPGEESSCLQRRPISTAVCQGGVGYYYAGGSAAVSTAAGGDGYGSGATVFYEGLQGDPASLVRPDGTTCSMFNAGSGPYIKLVVCPSGWSSNACTIRPSLTHCATQSSSSVGGQSSASKEENVCAKYPELSICNTSSSSGGVGGDTSGVGCEDLQNCNWANLETQLAQLDVSSQTKEDVEDIVELLKSGYQLDAEQAALSKAIKSELERSGNALEDIAGKLDSLGGGLDSTGEVDTSGLGGATGDIAGQIAGDTIDDEIDFVNGHYVLEKARAQYDSIAATTEDSLDAYIALAGAQVSQALSPMTQYIDAYKGGTAVIDMSFQTGIKGIGCSDCKIDLKDIYGFNTVSFLNQLIKLAAAITAVIMVMYAIKTGGR